MRSFVRVDVSHQTAEGYFAHNRGDGSQGRTSNASNASQSLPRSPDTDSQATDTSTGDYSNDAYDARSRKSSGSAAPGAHNMRAMNQQFNIITETNSAESESVVSTPSAHPDDVQKQASGRAPSFKSVKRGNVRDEDMEIPLITARFKHVVTEGGHAIITGRDGETLQRCEDEPIHIPGAIQGFGALIALAEESSGKLVVRIVSENSKRVLGYTPTQLFALESFTDILSDEQADNLLDHIDFIQDEDADVEANGPEVFTMSIRGSSRRASKLWCAIHVHERNPGLIVCEFELEDDPLYPLVPLHDETPEPPEDTLSSEPTADELRDSTETLSRPLRVLKSARKRKGEAAAMEVFNIMSQVQEQLAQAPNLNAFLKVLVGVIKELTGFHRVMIYQFDQSWNGKVVTELVDPRATKDLYKGLHFPASDIPAQARDLYRINKVRLLYDRDQETARLVCRTLKDLETPLDMTYTYLRAMSPIHTKYLSNMAVRSSMSVSINAFNKLWGLISCHAYGSKGTRVSFPIRKMCRLVGDSASRNLERLSYASRLQARKLINTSSTSANPTGYIIASSDDLLKLFDADFGLLSIKGETKILGKIDAIQEALAMLEYLRLRGFTSVLSTPDVKVDFPDLRYPPGFQIIAGLLLVPLSVGGVDFIVFFRRGQTKEVKWAGNPYEKFVKEGTEGYLEPRKSFKTWSETVIGKCREWTEEEIETAAVLCLVYGKFIQVWRQKEQALQNTQLTKLLLANSAHEVRTPLNAIINYLEIALEGSLDQETRDNLAKSHSASKSLIYVINDLLDLTKTEESKNLVLDEVFELRSTFREAVDMFQGDAKRKQIRFDVVEPSDLPEKVIGDARRVRQAISNVTANAIEATTTGGVKVELGVVSQADFDIEVEIIVEDTGRGMNAKEMDGLFAQLEQVQAEDDNTVIEDTIAPDSSRLSVDGETIDPEKQEKRALGLGLALVARIVGNMNGQLRLKSEEGKGSRFVIQFPFQLPGSSDRMAAQPPDSTTGSMTDSAITEHGVEAFLDGHDEVTLVGGTSSSLSQRRHSRPRCASGSRQLSRRDSGKSAASVGSKQSLQSISSNQSAKSDVDRLIEAMQESPLEAKRVGRPRSGTSTNHQDRFHGQILTKKNDASKDYFPLQLQGRASNQPRAQHPTTPGTQIIQDCRTPLEAIRVSDSDSPLSDNRIRPQTSRRIEPTHDILTQDRSDHERKLTGSKDGFVVLVAEDDPINSRIIQKRLLKSGHHPHLTSNGEECSAIYGEKPGTFDAVLMDIQVSPILGIKSTTLC